MSAPTLSVQVRSLFGMALGVALMGCGTSMAHKTEATREKVAVRPLVALSASTAYLDHATNARVSLESVLGEHGAVVLVLDQRACESCLAIDVEIRALRARNPRQPVLVFRVSTMGASPCVG